MFTWKNKRTKKITIFYKAYERRKYKIFIAIVISTAIVAHEQTLIRFIWNFERQSKHATLSGKHIISVVTKYSPLGICDCADSLLIMYLNRIHVISCNNYTYNFQIILGHSFGFSWLLLASLHLIFRFIFLIKIFCELEQCNRNFHVWNWVSTSDCVREVSGDYSLSKR